MSSRTHRSSRSKDRLVANKPPIMPLEQLPPKFSGGREQTKPATKHSSTSNRHLSKQELIDQHTQLKEQIQTRQTQLKALQMEKKRLAKELKELEGDNEYSDSN